MIFKTFESNIDKISSKWGMFGKSLNDIGTAIIGRITDINKTFQAKDNLVGSIKNSDSIWKRLYPSKESIKSQIIDIDALFPKQDNSYFSSRLTKLVKFNQKVADGSKKWQDYFKNLSDGEKWQIEFVQNTDLQKASLSDVKKAYDSARTSALAHNKALKDQTLSAKASKAALQALATIGNLAASYFIPTVISSINNIITANDRFLEKAQSLGNQFVQEKNSIEDYKNKIKELHSTINDNSSSFEEVTQARVDLMGIQDELIEKFGTEKNTIDTITDAIDGQSNALDRLTKKQYLEWKNDFNDKDFGQSITDYISSNNVSDGLYHLIGFEFEEARKAFTKPTQTNIDKMVSEMRWVGFDIKKTGNEVLDSLIEDIHNPSIYEDTFHIYGENLSDVYKDLISIQELEKLKEMKLSAEAKKLTDGIEETLTHMDFPTQHWTRIRTNNTIERPNREIKRRTRAIGAFPDGQSALMLVCARLRHVAGTQWGTKRYMNMDHLYNMALDTEPDNIAG